MKKLLIAILCCAFILGSGSALAEPTYAPEISAQSAILYCADTGETIFARFADEKMLIASTTKIMTAIIAIETLDLDEDVEIRPEWCGIEGSSMYLTAGAHFTVRDLLKGVLLVSGNDAAAALADLCAGNAESFAELMNRKAAALGMTGSSFKNPHGLDEEGHYSTAADMAKLAAYCMENPEFKSLVSLKSCVVGELTLVNHNRLLSECEGCIGLKTGYTQAAGRTLVSCVERNGMRLICATLNAPDDWNDHMKLYDWGYSNYCLTVFDANTFSAYMPVISSEKPETKTAPENRIAVMTEKGASVTAQLDLPGILFAGGMKGEKVGEIHVFVDGVLAASEKMVYTEDVPIDYSLRLSALERLIRSHSKPYYMQESFNEYEGKNTENHIGVWPCLTPSG